MSADRWLNGDVWEVVATRVGPGRRFLNKWRLQTASDDASDPNSATVEFYRLSDGSVVITRILPPRDSELRGEEP